MSYSIAIAIPWFGKELTGGAETLTYHLATRLAALGHQVTILTTLSASHAAFFGADEVPKGPVTQQQDGQLQVKRFPVDKRTPRLFHSRNGMLMGTPRESLIPGCSPLSEEDERLFWHNNINSTPLVKYIEDHHGDHDYFIFLPYPFGVILEGVKAAGAKALLQPCLHDESYGYLSEMADCFLSVPKLLFNSNGEMEVAAKLYGPAIKHKSVIVGSGVEVDLGALAAAPKPELKEPYVLYIGKREAAKNVDQLMLAYQTYRQAGGKLRLVLAGAGTLPLEVEGVVDMGLVSEEQKLSLLRHSTALINPSIHESFSRVLFESWFAERPVVVHQECAATAGFLRDAGDAGYSFNSQAGLSQLLWQLEKAEPSALETQGRCGFQFAKKFAQWDSVIKIYERIFDQGQETTAPSTAKKSSLGRIVQILPNVDVYDAISNHTFFLKGFFERLGYESLVLVDHRPNSLAKQVKKFSAQKIQSDDILMMHHSTSSGAQVDCFVHHPGKKLLIYHNITPHHFFEGISPNIVAELKRGRAELSRLAPDTPIAFGDSEYNREELQMMGFANTQVLPLLITPENWALKPDPKVMGNLSTMGGKHILFVGRIAPNKCQTDLVRLMSQLVQIRPDTHLWMVGGYDPNLLYFKELQQMISVLGLGGQITLTNKVDQPALMSYYMKADLFLSMSEHEGFGVPLVEAQWFDLPVFAYASSAVPETLGDAAFLFYDKHNFDQLAREIEVILKDPNISRRMCELQAHNREKYLPETLEALYLSVLQPGEAPTQSDTLAPAESVTAKKTKRPRWAFVVQRCGDDVVGGAEAHCLQTATAMSKHVDVELLTTCAKDYTTWENHFPAGAETWGENLQALRFPVKSPRIPKVFAEYSNHVFAGSRAGQVMDVDQVACEEWITKQGPEVPELLEHLKAHHQDYDAIIFYTYLYYPTYFGSQVCPEKSWLVTVAHDEPPIYLPAFDDLINRVKGVVFNTPQERAFLHRRFPQSHLEGDVISIGMTPPPAEAQAHRFTAKHQIDSPYVLYVGRMENSKGSDLLFDYFTQYKAERQTSLKLVLAGKPEIKIPKHPDILFVGFVDEQEKHDAMAGCEVLINPSPFESLSMILLEAWYNKKPVLVNQRCEVTVDQTKRANGGSWFHDYPSFRDQLDQLLENKQDYSHTKRFVEMNYSWPVIEEKYLALIHPNGVE